MISLTPITPIPTSPMTPNPSTIYFSLAATPAITRPSTPTLIQQEFDTFRFILFDPMENDTPTKEDIRNWEGPEPSNEDWTNYWDYVPNEDQALSDWDSEEVVRLYENSCNEVLPWRPTNLPARKTRSKGRYQFEEEKNERFESDESTKRVPGRTKAFRPHVVRLPRTVTRLPRPTGPLELYHHLRPFSTQRLLRCHHIVPRQRTAVGLVLPRVVTQLSRPTGSLELYPRLRPFFTQRSLRYRRIVRQRQAAVGLPISGEPLAVDAVLGCLPIEVHRRLVDIEPSLLPSMIIIVSRLTRSKDGGVRAPSYETRKTTPFLIPPGLNVLPPSKLYRLRTYPTRSVLTL
ncbi:hypothetical protein K435DRAFT_869385 [Dendrothele bispora CBS 962.96]|uniref:Uncharacterized protein n=1 Tax=Dendrothele bispora (strain CBS 962.96) TaxID=1314807 RepID=A0A4S8L9V3_DENBC|nr:hypothetical protein K435DRAFT_869385 [Dendrothele bispora CBS 962.96]